MEVTPILMFFSAAIAGSNYLVASRYAASG